MNVQKQIMPEQFYSLDNNMSLEKIIRAQGNGELLAGKIVLWNSMKQYFHVDLGNGLYGILPLSNSSIYPILRHDGTLAPAVSSLIGRIVCVMVKEISCSTDNPSIVLSRRENMLNAFKALSDSINKTIDCTVTSIVSYGLFVDAGYGISGLIHFKHLCISRVRNYSDIGINVGNQITAKILSTNDSDFHVSLDYKSQFKDLALYLKPGDMIEATCLNPISKNRDGFFAYVNPNTIAVVNFTADLFDSFSYGTKVLAIVKKPKVTHPDSLNLRFVSFI